MATFLSETIPNEYYLLVFNSLKLKKCSIDWNASISILLLACTNAEAVGVFKEKSLGLRSSSFKEPVSIQMTFFTVVSKVSFLLGVKSAAEFSQKIERTSAIFLMLQFNTFLKKLK